MRSKHVTPFFHSAACDWRLGHPLLSSLYKLILICWQSSFVNCCLTASNSTLNYSHVQNMFEHAFYSSYKLGSLNCRGLIYASTCFFMCLHIYSCRYAQLLWFSACINLYLFMFLHVYKLHKWLIFYGFHIVLICLVICVFMFYCMHTHRRTLEVGILFDLVLLAHSCWKNAKLLLFRICQISMFIYVHLFWYMLYMAQKLVIHLLVNCWHARSSGDRLPILFLFRLVNLELLCTSIRLLLKMHHPVYRLRICKILVIRKYSPFCMLIMHCWANLYSSVLVTFIVWIIVSILEINNLF